MPVKYVGFMIVHTVSGEFVGVSTCTSSELVKHCTNTFGIRYCVPMNGDGNKREKV